MKGKKHSSPKLLKETIIGDFPLLLFAVYGAGTVKRCYEKGVKRSDICSISRKGVRFNLQEKIKFVSQRSPLVLFLLDRF